MVREGARLGIKKIYTPKMRNFTERVDIEIIELKSIFSLIEEIRTMNIFE